MKPTTVYWLSKLSGLGLLYWQWFQTGLTELFFLLLFLITMTLFRWNFPRLKYSVTLDLVVVAFVVFSFPIDPLVLALPLFDSLFFGAWWGLLVLVIPGNLPLFALSALSGFVLKAWDQERKLKQALRDQEVGRYYELETFQQDLLVSLVEVEHISTVTERARIARDIHDKAGHEIVGALLSFQAIRDHLNAQNDETMPLYDAALERLNTGMENIREAVHNLAPVNFLGVERLKAKCDAEAASFTHFGDTTAVSVACWSMLEVCLSEALTNANRHADATYIDVTLDVTPYLVRLSVINDGVRSTTTTGIGLRNLRQRAYAMGGNISVERGDLFRLTCTVPIRRSL